jgi:hypothetical protein
MTAQIVLEEQGEAQAVLKEARLLVHLARRKEQQLFLPLEAFNL